MEHGASQSVKEELQTVTIKTEVEAAATSTVHTDSKIQLNSLKPEAVLVHSVKSEPALLVKDEILDDFSHDGSEQQCVYDTATPVNTGCMNATCSTSLNDLLDVKYESADMDIGPTVLQHMDVYYTINKQNVSAGTEENSIGDDCNEAMPGSGVKKESAADKWGGSIIPQEDVTKERSVCGTLQNYQLTDVKDHFQSICMVQLVRLETFQCDLCDIVYTEKFRLFKHFQTVHGFDTTDSLIPQEDVTKERSECGTLQNYQLTDVKDDFQSICVVRLVRLETFQCDLCDIVYTEKFRLFKHFHTVHGFDTTDKKTPAHRYWGQKTPVDDFDEAHVQTSCLGQRKDIQQHLPLQHAATGSNDPKSSELYHKPLFVSVHNKLQRRKKPYDCDNCEAKFAVRKSLTRHMRVHTGENSYQCNNCDARFAGRSGLTRHMKVHTGVKPYRCDNCQARYARKEHLNRHMRVHTGEKPYQCDNCMARYARKENFNRHMTVHTGEKSFQCCNCIERFARKEHLNQHMRVHTGEKPYKCENCDAMFSHKQSLNKHNMRVHTDEKHYKCEYCDSRFALKKSLNRHMRVHPGVKPYKCNNCDATYALSSSLTRHMRVHTGEKPYQCCNCNSKFAHSTSLARHMRFHTGEKPYHCNNCDARFILKNDLIPHMRVHTGEKPYGCCSCDARFARKDNLNLHMSIHTGEKPYQCDNCDARFPHKRNLNLHMKVHTGEKPFQCGNCDAKFIFKGYLTQHMRVHTGEKPYQCNICHARFALNCALTRHMRIHTGEKPYKCNNCKARYARKDSLNQHIKVHTGEKPL